MISDSRIGIYKYIEDLLVENVTENVYLMNEPQVLTESDTTEGFIVVQVGDFVDAGEFQRESYAWARVFIRVYVPPMNRGRLNVTLYKEFEDAINNVIDTASVEQDSTYWIQKDSVLSMDTNSERNADNAYFMFVKSFVVMVDGEENV